MKASILDLRYRMNDVLKALDRNEKVSILYHGRLKGVISPAAAPLNKKVAEHPFFNLQKEGKPVEQEMERLRGGRYGDL
jgi:hypothetical protein